MEAEQVSGNAPYASLQGVGTDDASLCELLLFEAPDMQMLRRSASCPGLLACKRDGSDCPIHHHRIHIAYYSDAIREHTLANAQRLLVLASSVEAPETDGDKESPASPPNNSAKLARKALRYRKIYERMNGVDVTDPRFNASRFLGVTWHKLVP